MFCGKCGNENLEGIKFCTKCGGDLAKQTPLEKKYGSDSLDDAATSIQQDDPLDSFAVGSLFANRYEILDEGKRGGMGAVYKCKDTKLHKVLALKIIHPRMIGSKQALMRFRQEAAISQELQHKNIVNVHNLEEWEGHEYIIMEWIEGISLREIIIERKKENKPFNLDEAHRVIYQLSEALQYAHKYTVHRDVKPENILIEGFGIQDAGSTVDDKAKIKLTDFGIAKMLSPSQFTSTSIQMGTPYYMAPEQKMDAASVDQRADIYACGVVLFELLTLENVIGFELPSELNKHVPKEIDNIIKKAVATKPDNRYGDIKELSEEFHVAIDLKEEKVEEERKAEEKRKREVEQAKREEEERKRQNKQRQEIERRKEEEEKKREEERLRRKAKEKKEEQKKEEVRAREEAEERHKKEEERKKREKEDQRQELIAKKTRANLVKGLILVAIIMASVYLYNHNKGISKSSSFSETTTQQSVKSPESQRQIKLASLLIKADGQIKSQKYTSPVNDSAFSTLSEVLKIDPGNSQANKKIKEIRDIYMKWGNSAFNNKEYDKAKKHYEKVLYVDPGYSLAKLKLSGIEEKKADEQRKLAEAKRKEEAVKEKKAEEQRRLVEEKRKAEEERQRMIAEENLKKEDEIKKAVYLIDKSKTEGKDRQFLIENHAVGKSARQSSTYVGGPAYKAIDGNTDGNWNGGSVSHTNADNKAWWDVDLKNKYFIDHIVVYNRNESKRMVKRLNNYEIIVSNQPFPNRPVSGNNAEILRIGRKYAGSISDEFKIGRSGRYVRVQLKGRNYLHLAEVEVYGYPLLEKDGSEKEIRDSNKTYSTDKVINRFNGIWEGRGRQNNGSRWSIKITIDDDNYLIKYPSLSCGGSLNLLEESDSYMIFRENITYGKTNCVDGGKTEIRRTGEDSMDYTWYYANGRKGATGTLNRSSKQYSKKKETIEEVKITSNLNNLRVPSSLYYNNSIEVSFQAAIFEV